MHPSSSSASLAADEKNRGVAVEKLETVKKWGINTYKVASVTCWEPEAAAGTRSADPRLCLCSAQSR